MQREEPKKTKITIREDYPVSFASSVYGANINSIAFNAEFICRRDPELSLKILILSEKAMKLKNKPVLPNDDERFIKVNDKYTKYLRREENG